VNQQQGQFKTAEIVLGPKGHVTTPPPDGGWWIVAVALVFAGAAAAVLCWWARRDPLETAFAKMARTAGLGKRERERLREFARAKGVPAAVALLARVG
jgi:hypothetical protein